MTVVRTRKQGGRKPRARCIADSVSVGCLLVAAVSTTVRADPTPSSRNLAQVLFDQARELMAAGKYADACRKFDESQRLDPGGGTLLNLALCHEKEGRLASAWGELREALDAARRDRRAEREKLASEHLAAVEPRLPFLKVQVTRIDGAPKVEVRLDGTLLTDSALDTPIPVDPTDHVVEARAAGRKPWMARTSLHEQEHATLVVPVLRDALTEGGGSQPVGGATSSAASSASSGKRTAAYVAGGVAIAALGVGTYFGVAAIHDNDKTGCSDTCPDQQSEDRNSKVNTEAWVANIGFGVGIVGAGLAVYWLLTAPPSDPAPPVARSAAESERRVPLIVAPLSDRSGAFVGWRATW